MKNLPIELAGPVAFAKLKQAQFSVMDQQTPSPQPAAEMTYQDGSSPLPQEVPQRPTMEQLLQQSITDMQKSPVISLFMGDNAEHNQGNQRSNALPGDQQPQQKLAAMLNNLAPIAPKLRFKPFVGQSASQVATPQLAKKLKLKTSPLE